MHRILMLLAPALLAACGAQQPPATPGAPGVPAADEPSHAARPARRSLPARLDMPATADGGRATAFPPAWRGEIALEGGEREHCGIKRRNQEDLEPGGTYQVHLVCSRRVQLPDEGSRGFRVLEDGREVASGSLLP